MKNEKKNLEEVEEMGRGNWDLEREKQEAGKIKNEKNINRQKIFCGFTSIFRS
jgi:hypothetical protein